MAGCFARVVALSLRHTRDWTRSRPTMGRRAMTPIRHLAWGAVKAQSATTDVRHLCEAVRSCAAAVKFPGRPLGTVARGSRI